MCARIHISKYDFQATVCKSNRKLLNIKTLKILRMRKISILQFIGKLCSVEFQSFEIPLTLSYLDILRYHL